MKKYILYPANGAPIVIAAYLSDSPKPRKEIEKPLAEIGKIVAGKFKE